MSWLQKLFGFIKWGFIILSILLVFAVISNIGNLMDKQDLIVIALEEEQKLSKEFENAILQLVDRIENEIVDRKQWEDNLAKAIKNDMEKFEGEFIGKLSKYEFDKKAEDFERVMRELEKVTGGYKSTVNSLTDNIVLNREDINLLVKEVREIKLVYYQRGR